MPLQREETVHGWPCKFYANDVVKVGTKATRFTLKVPADEGSWFATRLRAELIRRELVVAAELPTDGAGDGLPWQRKRQPLQNRRLSWRHQNRPPPTVLRHLDGRLRPKWKQRRTTR